ncbi:MAG: hypothetical protein JKY37_30975 [Nannocystaceae bacterium]|nr:hypothetical protein [Nannocystaceae bacterium]
MNLRAALVVVSIAIPLGCSDDADANTVASGSTSAAAGATTDGGVSGDGSEATGARTPAPLTGSDSDFTTSDSETSAADSTGEVETGADSGEAGESASSTGSLPEGQWSVTELTYTDPSSTISVTLEDCTFCDATLNGTTLLVRYQQAEGWTVWSLDIPVASQLGEQPITDDYSGAYVVINEQSPELPDDFTGFYPATSGSGTLTLTQADIEPGGVVAGTLVANLELGNVSAELHAEFYAEIPNL